MSAGQPRLVPAIGAVDGVNKTFKTPTAYISGTVFVYHNGVLLDPAGCHTGPDGDGWTETAADEIEMNFAPRTGDTMFIYYEDRDRLTGGGFSGGVPVMISADELAPIIRQLCELKPEVVTVEQGVDLIPELFDADLLKPEMHEAIDLKPVILGAEVS